MIRQVKEWLSEVRSFLWGRQRGKAEETRVISAPIVRPAPKMVECPQCRRETWGLSASGRCYRCEGYLSGPYTQSRAMRRAWVRAQRKRGRPWTKTPLWEDKQ